MVLPFFITIHSMKISSFEKDCDYYLKRKPHKFLRLKGETTPGPPKTMRFRGEAWPLGSLLSIKKKHRLPLNGACSIKTRSMSTQNSAFKLFKNEKNQNPDPSAERATATPAARRVPRLRVSSLPTCRKEGLRLVAPQTES